MLELGLALVIWEVRVRAVLVHACVGLELVLEMLLRAGRSQSRLLDQLGQLATAFGVLLRVRSTSCPGSQGLKLDQGCSGQAVTSQYARAAHAFGGATRIAGSTGCSRAVAFPSGPCHCAGAALGSVARLARGVGRSRLSWLVSPR